MDISTYTEEIGAANPLDTIEQFANNELWLFERSAEDELHITVTGSWCDYHLTLNWRPDLEALHLAVTFDMRAPDEKRTEICRLLALVNEQLWIGHFDLWSDDRLIMFRHGMLLHGDARVTPEQGEAMLRLCVEACERFYPAFQFVVWAGKTAEQAVQACMFETEGEA
jgi:hypothetical protein